MVLPTSSFTYVAEDLDVTFTDTSTDSDGTIASRSWTFGDGTSSTATNPTHVYDQPGTYTVTLLVTDNSAGTNSSNQSITVTGISAYEYETSRGTWKETVLQIRTTANADQRFQQADYVMGQGLSLTQQLALYKMGVQMNVASRGLSANYPEETLYGYWAACVLGYQALEISVQKSSSGTFWCFYDTTTTRTTGTTGTIASMTDAQISVLNNVASATDNTSQPVRPVAKLTDVLAIYGGKRLIFIEDRTGANTTAILDLMDANGGTDWYVWKQPGIGTKPTAVTTRGYKSWGYFFDTDMASNFTSKWSQWDYIGLDFNSSDSTIATAMTAVNDPSRFINHIIASSAQRDRMLALKVRGLMVSNSHTVTPVVALSPALNHAVITHTTGTATTNIDYTFGFTPASGNLLVVVAAGQVTWTTPSGWTRQVQQISDGADYIFTKVSDGTETKLTTTHNGTGGAAFPDLLEIWEFPAGSTVVTAVGSHTGTPGTLAAASGLTGTNTFITAISYATNSQTSGSTVTVTGMSPATEVTNRFLPGTTDGIVYSSWRADNYSSATTPGGTATTTNVSGSAESVMIVVHTP